MKNISNNIIVEILLFNFSLKSVVNKYISNDDGIQKNNICIKSPSIIFLNIVILYMHSKKITVNIQNTISCIFFLFTIATCLLNTI